MDQFKKKKKFVLAEQSCMNITHQQVLAASLLKKIMGLRTHIKKLINIRQILLKLLSLFLFLGNKVIKLLDIQISHIRK
jgi:hypothetical protein